MEVRIGIQDRDELKSVCSLRKTCYRHQLLWIQSTLRSYLHHFAKPSKLKIVRNIFLYILKNKFCIIIKFMWNPQDLTKKSKNDLIVKISSRCEDPLHHNTFIAAVLFRLKSWQIFTQSCEFDMKRRPNLGKK